MLGSGTKSDILPLCRSVDTMFPPQRIYATQYSLLVKCLSYVLMEYLLHSHLAFLLEGRNSMLIFKSVV